LVSSVDSHVFTNWINFYNNNYIYKYIIIHIPSYTPQRSPSKTHNGPGLRLLLGRIGNGLTVLHQRVVALRRLGLLLGDQAIPRDHNDGTTTGTTPGMGGDPWVA